MKKAMRKSNYNVGDLIMSPQGTLGMIIHIGTLLYYNIEWYESGIDVAENTRYDVHGGHLSKYRKKFLSWKKRNS